MGLHTINIVMKEDAEFIEMWTVMYIKEIGAVKIHAFINSKN